VYNAHENLYVMTYRSDGQTHRLLVDDFDWANMLNLGHDIVSVEPTDIPWPEPSEPRMTLD
jgi:hypothetical protein